MVVLNLCLVETKMRKLEEDEKVEHTDETDEFSDDEACKRMVIDAAQIEGN